jgi:DNA-binding response OmpR family regulator
MTRQQQKHRGKLVLIVEDSPTQARELTFILEEHGFSVTCFPAAEKALDYLRHHTPAIIITDILMSGMNGFEFCARVKNDERLKTIPVLILTILSDPSGIIQGLECGADNFISKPCQADYLVAQIDYMLENVLLRKHWPEKAREMDVVFAGKTIKIKSTQVQILDHLLSSFDVFVRKNRELEAMNRELAAKNERIKALQGLVPICANCKKIRDDHGYWRQVDHYLEEHSDADFNIALCPQCAAEQAADLHRNK